MQTRKQHWGYRLFAIVILPALFSIIINRIDRQTENMPSLKLVDRFFSAFCDFALYQHLAQTLWRFALGFAVALCCAIVLGIFMGRFKRVENALIDTVRFLRPIPSACVIPLAMLVISGIGNPLRVFVIAYGAFWPLLMHIYQASKDIDQTLIDTAATLGKSRWQIFWQIEFRAVQPAILSSSRIGIAIGLLLAVTSEMLVTGDPSGIGYLILDYERSFKHPEMLTAIVLLAICGWGLDWSFKFAEQYLLPWHVARNKTI
jgi:ABC-type nitrate/sulfonate/bicarbonate transport system permease component